MITEKEIKARQLLSVMDELFEVNDNFVDEHMSGQLENCGTTITHREETKDVE